MPCQPALDVVRANCVDLSKLTAKNHFSSLPNQRVPGVVMENGEEIGQGVASYVVGGERAILEELVEFRALVRSAALQDLKEKKGTDNMAAIMRACDKLRDRLPEFGVEVMDTKNNQDPQWRFCVPKGRKQ